MRGPNDEEWGQMSKVGREIYWIFAGAMTLIMAFLFARKFVF